MNATDALNISESKIPSILEDEYDSIIRSVKYGIEKGEKEAYLLRGYPNQKNMDRLIADGYRFFTRRYNIMGHFLYFGDYITWEKEIKKDNFFTKFITLIKSKNKKQ